MLRTMPWTIADLCDGWILNFETNKIDIHVDRGQRVSSHQKIWCLLKIFKLLPVDNNCTRSPFVPTHLPSGLYSLGVSCSKFACFNGTSYTFHNFQSPCTSNPI
jgi:hypothetical protein